MTVAKRQRNGKACENRTKNKQTKNPLTRVRTSGETNTPPSWPAQFAKGRLKGERRQMHKRRKPRLMRPSPFGSAHPQASKVYYTLLAK